eukprot:1216177-Prymnesium_polylepis.1
MYACAKAFEELPRSAAYVREHSDRIDVCCHGWRWWPQHNMAEEVEREHIRLAVESLRRTVGVTDTAHLGWYGRYAPSVNTCAPPPRPRAVRQHVRAAAPTRRPST